MPRTKKVLTTEEQAALAEKEALKEQKKLEKAAKAEAKKKGNGQDVVMPSKRGAWSDPGRSLVMEKMYVELELLEPALGTSPSDQNLLETYIASNAPDAASKQEEVSALGEQEVFSKQTTIFMHGWFQPVGHQMVDPLDRRSGGCGKIDKESMVRLPFFWNYQLRGMFKDSCGLLSRNSYGKSAGITAFKKVIDGGIMVHPRRIAIETAEFYYDDATEDLESCNSDKLRICQRPLRTSGPSGERTAIASSEEIPAGSRIKFCIEYADPKMKDAIIEWLNYGSVHGLGAWRNSGRGTFRWREVNPDYSPIEE